MKELSIYLIMNPIFIYFINQFVNIAIYLSAIYPTINYLISNHQSIYLSIYLLSIYLYIYLSIYLPYINLIIYFRSWSNYTSCLDHTDIHFRNYINILTVSFYSFFTPVTIRYNHWKVHWFFETYFIQYFIIKPGAASRVSAIEGLGKGKNNLKPSLDICI